MSKSTPRNSARTKTASVERICRIETFESRYTQDASGLAELAADHAAVVAPNLTPDAHITTDQDAVDMRGLTGVGQTVVIIDSGIAYDHVAFRNGAGAGIGAGRHIVGGWDFAENDADPYDDGPMGTHGTHVAGIIGSLDARYPGLAPGADLVALRVFDDNGQGDFHRIEDALHWVHAHLRSFANPITTVNLSLGARWNAEGAPEWSIIEDELAQLETDGLFISVAAGNSFARFGQQVGLSYPAASAHVVPVGSVDADGRMSSFSQRNDRILAADGRDVVSAVPDYAGNFNYRADDFLSLSGTSMAAPRVAAAAVLVREALVKAGRAQITQDDIYAILRNTADLVFDPITNQSYHRLNVEAAIDAVLPAGGGGSTPSPTPTTGDWGRIDFATHNSESAAGESWRTFTASRDGVLTVEVFTATTNGSVELYDAAGRLLTTARATAGGWRIDANVVAGTGYRLRMSALGESVSVRLANLVVRDGDAVYVYGTGDADTFSYMSGNVQHVSVNGMQYAFAASEIARVYFLGGDGRDAITMTGGDSIDVSALRPGKASLRGVDYQAIARDVESVVVDGRLGSDEVYFADTAGDDEFSSASNHAQLTSGEHTLTADGFEVVRARATSGHDTATLRAADTTDRFSQTNTTARFIGQNQFREISGFDTVSTFAALTSGSPDVSSVVSVNAFETVDERTPDRGAALPAWSVDSVFDVRQAASVAADAPETLVTPRRAMRRQAGVDAVAMAMNVSPSAVDDALRSSLAEEATGAARRIGRSLGSRPVSGVENAPSSTTELKSAIDAL